MGEHATGIYRPRNHRDSPLFQLMEDYYDMFERCYEENIRRLMDTDKTGSFCPLPGLSSPLIAENLEKIFTHKVLKMLRKKEKITDFTVEKLMSWHHTGFNVHIADVISSTAIPSRERAGSYLVRSPVSLEKMRYLPEEGTVIYGSFTGEKKSYDALDFIALLSSHITNRYEHRVIYYGWWSSRARGVRMDETAPTEVEHTTVEPVLSTKEYRRRWAALIQKIWKSDPLMCPECSGTMKITGIVNLPETAKKILVHLNLWGVPENTRPPPRLRTEEEYYPDEDRSRESSYYNDTFFEDEVA